MGSLTQEQIDRITAEIDMQGVSFDPLRSELLDHMLCDIEIQMSDGAPFDKAWQSVKKNVDNNHLKLIQTETMELIKRKNNPVRIAAMMTLSTLSAATLFKVMHLPGATMLMIIFMVAASLTLILAMTRGARVYDNTIGKSSIWFVAFPLVALIGGLSFKVLHLPGATFLLYLSVVSLCLVFPTLSAYFYSKGSVVKEHLLIKLVDKHGAFIERTTLTLIAFGIALNYTAILIENKGNLSGLVFFVFAIVLTGIYAFSTTWKFYTTASKGRLGLLIFSSLAFIMFVLPIVGNDINYVVRHVFAYLPPIIFSLISTIYYSKTRDSNHGTALTFFSLLLIGYPVLRFVTKMYWFEGWLTQLTSNPSFILGFLLSLFVLLFAYRKETVFKLLIILTIASHMIPNL